MFSTLISFGSVRRALEGLLNIIGLLGTALGKNINKLIKLK
jgi:hypothetical protein